MNAFAAATDLLFADPNLGRAAWHRDGEGQFTPVRVILKSPDDVVGFGEARIWSETTIVDMRVSELSDPRPGDQLILGEETFVIQGEPKRDRERLVWTLDLRPES